MEGQDLYLRLKQTDSFSRWIGYVLENTFKVDEITAVECKRNEANGVLMLESNSVVVFSAQASEKGAKVDLVTKTYPFNEIKSIEDVYYVEDTIQSLDECYAKHKITFNDGQVVELLEVIKHVEYSQTTQRRLQQEVKSLVAQLKMKL